MWSSEEICAHQQHLAKLVEIKSSFFPLKREEKSKLVESQIASIVELFHKSSHQFKPCVEASAWSCYVKGRAFDCREEYCEEAELHLASAVKVGASFNSGMSSLNLLLLSQLHPEEIRYWNAMGHVLWKKGKVRSVP